MTENSVNGDFKNQVFYFFYVKMSEFWVGVATL